MSEAWENPRRWAQHMHKTEICRFWRNGECQRGDRCKYAHGEDEVQPRGERLSTKQMSELVSEWEEGKGGGKDCEGGKGRKGGKGTKGRKGGKGTKGRKGGKPGGRDRSRSRGGSRDDGDSYSDSAERNVGPKTYPRSADPWNAAASGDMWGSAVNLGHVVRWGPQIWVGTMEDAREAPPWFDVVVVCKHADPPALQHPQVVIQADFLDSSAPSIVSEMVWLSERIDQYVDEESNVLFVCKGGRHRSYATALCYFVWRDSKLSGPNLHRWCKSLNDRFKLLWEPTWYKGKLRRGLGCDVVAFIDYLKNLIPRSANPIKVIQF